MSRIRYSSQEIDNVTFVQVTSKKNVIYKMYDLHDKETDNFNRTPSDYYLVETHIQQQLSDVTYIAGDGREMRLIPKCLEIGKNYIIMEKYDTSMVEHIKKGELFEHHADGGFSFGTFGKFYFYLHHYLKIHR